ncbi:hypothetical protein BC832DRAFT_323264 [Gaertneriomyces semiglobifer]|nr:hypothetical protein BC832DRAFT_323264 [Gaertneriomyces semiglobifer]
MAMPVLTEHPLPAGTEARDYDLDYVLLWNAQAYWVSVALLLISILAICLNSFILFLGARERELRSPANLFVLSLAFTDFSIGIYKLCHFIPTIIAGGWSIGGTWCQAHGFLIVMVEAQSLFGMGALAWERYCSIVKRQPLSRRGVVKIVAGIWAAAIIIASAQWWGPGGRYVMQSSLMYCAGDWSGKERISVAFTLLCTGWVAAALIFFAVLYYRINRAVHITFRALHKVARTPRADSYILPADVTGVDAEGREVSSMSTAKHDERHQALEQALTRKSVILVLVFWMGWAPYMGSFLYELILKRQSPQWLDSLSAIMVITNSVWNPFLFIFLDSRWKNAARTIFGMSPTSSFAASDCRQLTNSQSGARGQSATAYKRPQDSRSVFSGKADPETGRPSVNSVRFFDSTAAFAAMGSSYMDDIRTPTPAVTESRRPTVDYTNIPFSPVSPDADITPTLWDDSPLRQQDTRTP